MKARPKLADWSAEVRLAGSPERERFLESHIGVVKHMALRLSGRLPSSVELDDLIHDGIVGLIDAADRYDPNRGVEFVAYARTRIDGAMRDGLRERDWRPRSVRARQRDLDAALARAASATHNPPTEEDVARELSLDLASYRGMLVDLGSGPLLSLEDVTQSDDSVAAADDGRPDVKVERGDLFEAVAEEIERIPDRERRVLELYYHDRLNMKEIGAVLGLTESRICQLHSQAASRLRVALERRLHARPAELAGRS